MAKFIGASSPHIFDKASTSGIMRDVIIALIPAGVMAVVYFGLPALGMILLGVTAAVLAEAGMQKLMKKPVPVRDLSAVITGLLVAYNIPAGPGIAPYLLCIGGSVFAIVVVKQLFGGLGHNFMNPALTARAFLMAAWAKPMSTFVESGSVDAVASVTPLGYAQTVTEAGALPYTYSQLFFGQMNGVIGEVCKAALLLGAVYLLIRKVISWRIPVMYIGTVALLSLIPSAGLPLMSDPLYQVLSGGLILGAFFMATDYVTAPTTGLGQILMGVGCGIMTFVIRRFGAYPEGVSYSILFMNVVTPLIERFIHTKRFGEVKRNA